MHDALIIIWLISTRPSFTDNDLNVHYFKIYVHDDGNIFSIDRLINLKMFFLMNDFLH